MPEWCTGSGKDRRYTWDRHALEDWAVYGIASDGDGDHIGLEHQGTSLRSPVRRPADARVAVFVLRCLDGISEAPAWVYPWEPRKLLNVTSFTLYCQKVICDARYAEYRIVYRGDLSSDMLDRGIPEVTAFRAAQKERAEELRALLKAAITCGPSGSRRPTRRVSPSLMPSVSRSPPGRDPPPAGRLEGRDRAEHRRRSTLRRRPMPNRPSWCLAALLVLAAASAFGAGLDEEAADVLKITADYVWAYDPPPARDRRIVEYYDSIIARRTGVEATWQESGLTGKPGRSSYGSGSPPARSPRWSSTARLCRKRPRG